MSCPEHAEYPIRGVGSPRTVRRPGVSCEGQTAQSRRNVGGRPSVGHVSPPSTRPQRSRSATHRPSRPTPCQRGGDHVGRVRRRGGRGHGGRCGDHRGALPPATRRSGAPGRNQSIPSGISNIGGAAGVAVIACSLLAWSPPIADAGSHCVHVAPRPSGRRRLCRGAADGMAVRAGGSGLVIFVTHRSESDIPRHSACRSSVTEGPRALLETRDPWDRSQGRSPEDTPGGRKAR